MGFNYDTAVDPEGIAGGLCLWWDDKVKLKVSRKSKKSYSHKGGICSNMSEIQGFMGLKDALPGGKRVFLGLVRYNYAVYSDTTDMY